MLYVLAESNDRYQMYTIENVFMKNYVKGKTNQALNLK